MIIGIEPETSSLFDVLNKIRKRPAMYLGQNSIFSLQAFLDGYYYARREIKTPLTDEEKYFQAFLIWIRERFEVKGGQLWASILRFQSADEGAAVKLFFDLLDDYMAQNPPVTLK